METGYSIPEESEEAPPLFEQLVSREVLPSPIEYNTTILNDGSNIELGYQYDIIFDNYDLASDIEDTNVQAIYHSVFNGDVPEACVYPCPTDKHRVGIALILCQFNNTLTEGEVDHLKKVFRKLKYKVVSPEENYCKIIETITSVIENEVVEEDSNFVCVISAHGGRNRSNLKEYIVDYDGKSKSYVYLEDNIIPIFSKCGKLRLKPKLFFIQACRGFPKGMNTEITMAGGPSITYEDPTDYIPPWDFFFAFSTSHGYPYTRPENPEREYNFLCVVLEVFSKLYMKSDVMSMLHRVNFQLNQYREDNDCYREQVSWIESSLRGPVFLCEAAWHSYLFGTVKNTNTHSHPNAHSSH